MQVKVETRNALKIAVVDSDRPLLCDAQQAVDFIAKIKYDDGCNAAVIAAAALPPAFFELRTGLAGEVLQKFTLYQLRLAIIGAFDRYASKSLRDFIRESNNGGNILFLPDEQTALKILAGEA